MEFIVRIFAQPNKFGSSDVPFNFLLSYKTKNNLIGVVGYKLR